MSTIIKLRCIDQVLTFESTPVIASGGLEEDFVQVSFCSKWDGLAKTAVFWRSEEDAYHVLLDDNGQGAIPPEVLTDEGVVYFGVFGVSADGRQRTSEVMRYNIAKGAIKEGTKPSDPTPDVYTQLMAQYTEMGLAVKSVVGTAAKASEDAAAALLVSSTVEDHINNKENPHAVTPAQIGAVESGETFDTKMQGGGVDPIYPRVSHHARTITPTSLDDLAWEGRSYREIFEGHNAVYEDYDKSTVSWLISAESGESGNSAKFWAYGNYGKTDMDEVSASGRRSLVVESTNINTAISKLIMSERRFHHAPGDKVYVASMLRVDNIRLGTTTQPYHGCGVSVRKQSTNYCINAVATTVTDGFVLTSNLGTIESDGDYNFYIGCLGGYIEAKCYIDAPVVVNLSNLFRSPPDQDTMDALYENYIALCAGKAAKPVSVAAWQSGEPTAFTDEACLAAFVEEMNKKAAAIGMTHSSFVTPSGLMTEGTTGTGNVSATGDMARMTAAAVGYPEIGRIWRKAKVTTALGGSEHASRTFYQLINFSALESTQYSEKERPYLGGKGGTMNDNLSLVAVTRSDDGHLLAHAVTTIGKSTYPPIGKLTDLAERALAGEDVSGETVPDVVGAVTLLLPSGATWLFDEYDYRVLYATGETTAHNPASTSKVLTAMVALDWCGDIRTRMIRMKPLDNVGYSGDRFLMGQTMTMETALQVMLLISSNSVAHAIARTVGEVILRARAAL